MTPPPLIKGGQGRHPRDIEADGAWLVALLAFALCLVVGFVAGAWLGR